MPLTNTQYDEIMRKYNRIQSRRQRLQQEHQEEIQALLPRVTEINHEISDASIKKARELLMGSPSGWRCPAPICGPPTTPICTP